MTKRSVKYFSKIKRSWTFRGWENQALSLWDFKAMTEQQMKDHNEAMRQRISGMVGFDLPPFKEIYVSPSVDSDVSFTHTININPQSWP
jgi:hypothetical protein